MQIQIKLEEQKDALRGSLACLSHALDYIHSQTTKHMDIKPANILVKHVPSAPRARRWCFYIADFGHSKHFKDEEQSQTAGPVGTTPKWRAPEVYDKDVEGTSRGRSADVFSLGCVFLEILTVVCGKHLDDFTDFRNGGASNDGPGAFCLHVPRLRQWVDVLRQAELEAVVRPVRTELEFQESQRFDSLLQLVASMVQLDSSRRPVASVVSAFFRTPPSVLASGTAPNDYQHRGCCDEPPESFASRSFG
jgi:serine/threonine protein kinase